MLPCNLGNPPKPAGGEDLQATDDSTICMSKGEALKMLVYIKQMQTWVREAQACMAPPAKDAGISDATHQ